MTDSKAPTIICVASFFKGNDFIRECKRLGAAVVLLTREKLLDADWARESLDDLIAIPGKTSVQSYLGAATYVARQRRVSRVVALEEYDIVTAAHIREHLVFRAWAQPSRVAFRTSWQCGAKPAKLPFPSRNSSLWSTTRWLTNS